MFQLQGVRIIRPTDVPRAATRRPGTWATLVAAVALASAAGCGGDEKTYEISDIRTRKDAGPAAFEAPLGDRLAGRQPAVESGGEAPMGAAPMWSYSTPTGWEELPPAKMRDLGWRVTGGRGAECTFSALPGGAGGLVMNVNRWRKQMSIGETDEATVRAMPKKTLLGRPATFVELSGVYKGMGGQEVVSGAKLLGLVVELPMATAFLKLTGPADVVDAETAKFFALADSLKMKTGGEVPPGHPPTTAPAPTESAPFSWTAPPGWKKQGEKAMRLVSFVPEGAPHVDAYVSVLGGAAGGMRANVDRWRGQMGLAALSDAEFAALPRKKILGAEAVFVTLEGTWQGMDPGQGKAGWMLLGMVLVRADHAVFVKVTGPADEVRAERARFEAFCESFHD